MKTTAYVAIKKRQKKPIPMQLSEYVAQPVSSYILFFFFFISRNRSVEQKHKPIAFQPFPFCGGSYEIRSLCSSTIDVL